MRRYEGKGFSGLNNAKDASLIGETDLQDCQDIRVNVDRSISKRTGKTHVLAAAESTSIYGIFQFKINEIRTNLLATDSVIKQINAETASAVTTLLSGLNGNKYAKFLQWNNKVLYSNGQDSIKKVLATTYTYTVSTTNTVYKHDSHGRLINTLATGLTAIYDLVSSVLFLWIVADNNIYKYEIASMTLLSTTAHTAGRSIEYSSALDRIFVYGTNNIVTSYNASTMAQVATIDTTANWDAYAPNSYFHIAITPVGFTGTAKIYIVGLTGGGRISSTKMLTSLGGLESPNYLTGTGTTAINGCWADVVCTNISYTTSTGYGMIQYTHTDIATAFTMTRVFQDAKPRGGSTQFFFTESNIGKMAQRITQTNTEADYYIWQTSVPLTTVQYSTETAVDLTRWYDLCSPYALQTSVLATAGNPNATLYYRATWTLNSSGGETSGGAVSNVAVAASKKVEVTFDFGLDTVMTKIKAEALLIDRFKLYRKDGSADYLLQGTYPIYMTLNGAITDSALSLIVDTLNGATAPGESFYIKIDDEIILVTAINSLTFTIDRAEKGTTAAAHDDNSTIYLYSIIDNTASVAGNAACPTVNDYVSRAKYMAVNKEKLGLTGSTDYPHRFWYSSYNSETLRGDEDLILVNNWFDVGQYDGFGNTALFVYDDNFVVGKERSIYAIIGDPDNQQIARISEDIGIVSDKSVVQRMGGVFFLSREGIMFMLGTQIINLSKFWIPATINNINWDFAYLSHAQYFPKYTEIWWFVPTGTSQSCNSIIVLNVILSDLTSPYTNKTFYPFSQSCSASCLLVDSNGDDVMWTGDADKYVNLQDSGNADIAAAIDGYGVIKNHNFGFDNEKSYRRIITDLAGQSTATNLTVSYDTDNSGYTDKTVSMNFAGRHYSKNSIVEERGHYMKIRFRNASASQPFQVYNYMMDFKLKKIR